MLNSHFGEIASLLTAVCWTFTAMAFESAGKKVGSLSVNLIRLLMGAVLLSTYTYFSRGLIFPVDASLESWLWLLLSGIIGFVIGDLLLFQAFVVIGSRISMLIMSLTPPITAFIGWLWLKEQMTMQHWFGMFVTLAGIVMVILKPEKKQKKGKFNIRKMRSNYSIVGILLAFGGATGQALGLVLSKKGMGEYNAFAATQIRIFAGIIGFVIVFTFWRKWGRVRIALADRSAMKRITLGAVFGPFLGVSLSLLAIQHTNTGIASTIMAIVPILIILPAVIIFKEKVTLKEVIGAIISVAGVSIFFI